MAPQGNNRGERTSENIRNPSTGSADSIESKLNESHASATITLNDSKPSLDLTKDYVYGVHLSSGGKVSDYYWNNLHFRVGDQCVVESENGAALGSVTLARRQAAILSCSKRRIYKIIRQATKQDMDRAQIMIRKEKSAKMYCRSRILEHDLLMSLTRVFYTFDGSKAIFFFTADGRIDFRELVKDLVNFTRSKVEMRQIGVRDEAKLIGGCGPCGAERCCSTFINDFAPVSIKMAKNQGLSLNPSKISGVCGRLMCCLAFENDHYVKLQKGAPKLGKMVETPDGRMGKVVKLNLLKEEATVIYDDESKQDFNTWELAKQHPSQKPQKTDGKEKSKSLHVGKRDEQRARSDKPSSSIVAKDTSDRNKSEKPIADQSSSGAADPVRSRQNRRKRNRSRKRRKDNQ